MKIPQLFGLMNPTAPHWDMPDLSQADLNALYGFLVMFVGFDPRTPNRWEPIGSGFIVAANDTLIVISAAHIFSWWVDRILPPKPHTRLGIPGVADDFQQRLKQVMSDGLIHALVSPSGLNEGCICPVIGMSFNPNPSDMDIAVIQLPIPTHSKASDFTILPIDGDRFSYDTPVLMAGFTGGGRTLTSQQEPFSRGLYEQKLTVRVGRVGEHVEKPPGFRSSMYRVNIPSLPGMSGGPLILWRSTEYLNGVYSMATAVGIVSRSRLGTPILLNHCGEGETWVSPIHGALLRSVNTKEGKRTLSEEIKSDRIQTYGTVARSAVWVKDPDTGVVSGSLPK